MAEGVSARRSAARFGVGVATAIRWVRRWRESGERTARRQGNPGGSKLDPHAGFLLGLIEDRVDITLEEMRVRLAEERGVRAGIGTLWRFFDARGVTVKKRMARPVCKLISLMEPFQSAPTYPASELLLPAQMELRASQPS